MNQDSLSLANYAAILRHLVRQALERMEEDGLALGIELDGSQTVNVGPRLLRDYLRDKEQVAVTLGPLNERSAI